MQTLKTTGVNLQVLRRAKARIDAKREELQGESRKIVHKALAVKQFEKTEKELEKVLIPFFVLQGRSMVTKLNGMKSLNGSTKKKEEKEPDYEKQAHALASKIFKPEEWTDDLMNRMLPVLAVSMAEAAVAHLLTLGIDVRKKKKEKATTASEWAAADEADWDDLLGIVAESGLPIGFMTEIPLWMQQSIAERLSESFGEDYWTKISETTLGNAETVIRQGLEKGHSISKMAGSMREYFLDGGFRYARARSENIARTESGNALNGARKDSVAKLQEELPEVPMIQSWLSVLGNTTRAIHADLDGVPEDKNKMWNLAGYSIPWPAHYSLPPENRCNCQCSLTIEFGMRDAEAERLIQDYWEREGMEKCWGWIWRKTGDMALGV